MFRRLRRRIGGATVDVDAQVLSEYPHLSAGERQVVEIEWKYVDGPFVVRP